MFRLGIDHCFGSLTGFLGDAITLGLLGGSLLFGGTLSGGDVLGTRLVASCVGVAVVPVGLVLTVVADEVTRVGDVLRRRFLRLLLGVVGLPRGNPRRSTRQLEVAAANHLLQLTSVGERDDDRHHIAGDTSLNVHNCRVTVDAGVGRVRVCLTDGQGYPFARDCALVLGPQHLALFGQAFAALDDASFDQLGPVVGVLVKARTERPEGEGLGIRRGQLQLDVDDGVKLLLVGQARVGDDGANLTFVTRVDLGGCGAVDEDLLEARVSARLGVDGRGCGCLLLLLGLGRTVGRRRLQVFDLGLSGDQFGVLLVLFEGNGVGERGLGGLDLLLGSVDEVLVFGLRAGERFGVGDRLGGGVAGASRQHGNEDGRRGNRGGHPGVLRTHFGFLLVVASRFSRLHICG